MIDSVAGPGTVPTGTAYPSANENAAASSKSAAETKPPATPAAPSDPAARLHLERDAAGGYVYRLVDVATGRVLAELPREAVGQLTDLSGYQPGAMASTTA